MTSGATIGPDDEAATAERVRAGFWTLIGRVAGRLPFAEDAAAAYFCAFDPETPRRVRLTLLGALGYFVLPTDLVPDFLPALGFTDDLTVITTAVAMVAGHIRPIHREAAARALGKVSGTP